MEVRKIFVTKIIIFTLFLNHGYGATMREYDTIVVGMGASGAAAAASLAAAGRHVLAVEAQPRVGGRVMTVPFAGGVVELGAEWIHGTENSRVYDAAMNASVHVLPQDLTMEMFRSDGSVCKRGLCNELITCALSATEDPPNTPQRLGDFITAKVTEYITKNHKSLLNDTDFVENFLHFMNYFVDNYEATNDWNDVTTKSSYAELGGHQHMSWHRNGYRTFFDILLNKYNNGPGLPHLEMKLGTEVTKISYGMGTSEKVRVTCKDGGVYVADNVIVTVSLGVLKDRYKTLFSPPLPKNKVDAIENMSMGVMDKIIFHFEDRWWPENTTFYGFIWRGVDRRKLSQDDKWMDKIFGASSPLGARNALTMWTSGETAKLLETLPEDVVKRKCLQLLKMFMGKDRIIPEPINMIRSTWYSNPYTLGSYTYDNAWMADHESARVDLGSPLVDSGGYPRVLFAGEATHPVRFSTVHGATETGLREARRLLPKSHI